MAKEAYSDWMDELFEVSEVPGIVMDTDENKALGSEAEVRDIDVDLMPLLLKFAETDREMKKLDKAKKEVRQKLIDTIGPCGVMLPDGARVRISRYEVNDTSDKGLKGRLQELGVWDKCSKSVVDSDALKVLMSMNDEVKATVKKKAQYKVALVEPKGKK